MPQRCPIVHSQACSVCQQNNWGPEIDDEQCTVVLLSSLPCTIFTVQKCNSILADGSQCSGQQTPDGKEYGLLRQTPSLALSHELLYHWAERLATGHPDTWTTSWLLTLLGDQTDEGEAAKARLFSLKAVWSSATLDFLQLQDIDYDSGFRCNCWQGEHSAGMPCLFGMTQYQPCSERQAGTGQITP